MRQLERNIHRQLRRSDMPVHIRRRTARQLARQAEISASLAALHAFTEAEIARRAKRLGGDLAAARAANQGAVMGEAVALNFLDFGRWISAGLDRLQDHVNGRGSS